jgi:hypothetical protein
MGYTTTFKNKFILNKVLDNATFIFLRDLNDTRRMRRRGLDAKFGIDGEFYTGNDEIGVNQKENDHNTPPRTQPGLWCKWTPTDDRMHIEWDGTEKFYDYVKWLEYLISKVLSPRGYVLNGKVKYQGEERSDRGTIEVCDNNVDGKRLITDYSINKLLNSGVAKTKITKEEVVILNNAAKAFSQRRGGGAVATTTIIAPKKTKHQIAKEKIQEAERKLLAQIQLLEDQLAEKNKENKRLSELANAKVSKVSVQDVMLMKIQKAADIKGTLAEFKDILRGLLES